MASLAAASSSRLMLRIDAHDLRSSYQKPLHWRMFGRSIGYTENRD
jgi:hypothetical protein